MSILSFFAISEPSLILHCLKVPQFLQRMEKRAREREEKHAMIRERRRQMEEERIKLKQQVSITGKFRTYLSLKTRNLKLDMNLLSGRISKSRNEQRREDEKVDGAKTEAKTGENREHQKKAVRRKAPSTHSNGRFALRKVAGVKVWDSAVQDIASNKTR